MEYFTKLGNNKLFKLKKKMASQTNIFNINF